MDPIIVGPDCVAGKHHVCDGKGYDNDRDEVIPCPCECHKEKEHG
jgi:hypothetical protein